MVQTALRAGTWGVCGTLVALVAACLTTITAGAQINVAALPAILGILSVALSMVAFAVAAGFASTIVPTAVALPTVIVVPYMWYFVTAGYGAGTSVATIGPADGLVWDFQITSTTTLLLRVLVWLAVVLVLLSTLLRSRLRRLARWMCSAAVAIVILGGFGTDEIPGAQHVICEGENPTLCLTKNQEASRPEMTRAVQQALQRVPATMRPSRLSSMDSPVGAARPILSNSKVVDRGVISGQVGAEVMAAGCRDSSPGREASQALLHWWWTTNSLPLDAPAYPGAPTFSDVSPGAQAASGRLARLGKSDRDRVLTQHARSISHCTLRVADLP